MSFWSTIVARNRSILQNWLSEQFEFLLYLTGLVLAFAVFRLLKFIGVEVSLVELLEKLDNCAIVVVFGLFLVRVIRQSLAATFRRS